MGILDEILSHKVAEVERLKASTLPSGPGARGISLARNAGEPLRLITEIKRRSPSAGALSTKLSVAERARCYADAGASMLSILTDSRFFDGSFEHLREARAACDLPLLCKDFVIHERQLDAALAFGADAVLLIVRCLSESALPRLHAAAKSRGLAVLVEVTDEPESQRALDAGAEWVGVNVRDLDTLAMDSARAARVLAMLPKTVQRVHLSGLKDAASVLKVAQSGMDAALIGEALMRLDDPSSLLASMRAAAAS
ncbi:MAG TPA: indole-3-glycerol phosphate synthase TrpC [Polyangiaceae bacterium]|nr:indole-3-glycerol phosphate synthase TrpC [Polyangiaceae bacterium]